MTTTTATTLTREEAAYAHLASFKEGERVVFGGRGHGCEEAFIRHPQRAAIGSDLMADAYLVAVVTGIGGDGGWAMISVASLLSGLFHIEHDFDHQWNGEQTWFDADGYVERAES